MARGDGRTIDERLGVGTIVEGEHIAAHRRTDRHRGAGNVGALRVDHREAAVEQDWRAALIVLDRVAGAADDRADGEFDVGSAVAIACNEKGSVQPADLQVRIELDFVGRAVFGELQKLAGAERRWCGCRTEMNAGEIDDVADGKVEDRVADESVDAGTAAGERGVVDLQRRIAVENDRARAGRTGSGEIKRARGTRRVPPV